MYMSMPPRRDHDELTKADLIRILEASASADEDHLFLMLLTHTGRRISELLALTVRYVDFNERCVWTNIEKRRKAQRRKMFLSDVTLAELRSYIADHHLTNSIGKGFRHKTDTISNQSLQFGSLSLSRKYLAGTNL